MKKDINNIPSKFLDGREQLEGKIVLSYYKNTDLFNEYPLNVEEDLLLDESKLLYSLAERMYNDGIIDVDIVSMEGYLVNLPDTKAKIEEYGGCKEVLNSAKTISTNNFDTYYDELVKNNYLIDLFQVQKELVGKYDTMKNEMNAQEVMDYVEYQITDIENGKSTKNAEVSNLFIDEEFMKYCEEEGVIETLSYYDAFPQLNNVLGGAMLGKLHIVSALSGSGKSTIMLNIIMSIINQGYKATIISNELSKYEYMMIIICLVLFDKFKYYKITRQKLQSQQQLNNEEKEMFRKACAYINENLKDNLTFVILNTSDTQVVFKEMKKACKLGSKIILYDTLKSSGGKDGWVEITDISKEFTLLAQKENVAIYLTFQTAPYTAEKYYLHRGLMSEGKNAIFMASTLIMMRPLRYDEFKGEKNYIKPYKLVKNETTGKYNRVAIDLENDGSQYNLIFVDKNRNGQSGQVILVKMLGQYGKFIEVGYAIPKMDM